MKQNNKRSSWLAPMWRDIDLLKKQNESIEKEIETLRKKNTEILRSKKLREARILRIQSIDSLTMNAIFKASALSQSEPVDNKLLNYDEKIFRKLLIENGLLNEDVDMLIDFYNRNGKGKIL